MFLIRVKPRSTARLIYEYVPFDMLISILGLMFIFVYGRNTHKRKSYRRIVCKKNKSGATGFPCTCAVRYGKKIYRQEILNDG